MFKFIFSIGAISLFLNAGIYAQDRYELNSGWLCAPISKIKDEGVILSKPSHLLSGWMPAVVPGTVLTTMLANKQIPDPFYGMNNKLIPDIYTTGRDYYTYWFIKNFKEPLPVNGRQVWLQLRGINYSCDVFLNGHKLNDSTHKGMFLRQEYNITRYLEKNGNNRLAVIVYPPDPVGNANGGQGGDGMIAKNVTHQYVAGWDWIQPVRDRNTGIWDKVFIERTGAVNIKNPHVVTIVPGKRQPGKTQEPAIIKVSAEIQNSSNKNVNGVLQYFLQGNTITKKVSIAGNSDITISFPDVVLKNPRLWWPNGYGTQELYKIELQFLQTDKDVSDRENISFGVREIRKEWNSITGSSTILVNGQKIFIKGGNWIVSDAMLRLTDARYDAEVRFHRDMNLNLIRIWGGALMERPEFYHACDRYGLLVFQDLGMSGDCNGRWNDRMKLEDRQTRRKYPDDHALFLTSFIDQVKMIRNHPSLAIYCGGNEITPPRDILAAIKDSLLPALDATRIFYDYSNSDSMSHNTFGGNGDGPYQIQPTDTFWKQRTFPFNSEVGSVGMGDYESLQRFIPLDNMVTPEYTAPVVPRGRPVVKVDSVWDYHKYIDYNQYINLYGTAASVKDFADKAQLVNFDQYRALIEGLSARMWEWYTGVIIWKTQNPWTALRGQMYDYYLDPNACLYGLHSAGELIHAMYNPVEGNVMLVNNSFESLKNITLLVKTYDMVGRDSLLAKLEVNVEASGVKTTITIKAILDKLRKENGLFLSLELLNENKKTISENLYWLPDEKGIYSGLINFKPASINIKAKQAGKGKIEVVLSNPSGQPLSFFNRIALIDPKTKKRILPVFYSDNYISVLPGTQKKVLVEFAVGKVNPMISVEGWKSKVEFVKP